MTTFVIGALIVLGAFILGTAFGCKFCARSNDLNTAPREVSAQERERLLQDQRAFEDLLHYNQEVAYGQHSLGGDS